MRKINIRTPYFIIISDAALTVAKIEIRLWKAGQSEPTPATYIIEKPIPSATQTSVSFNVSNFAKEFIEPLTPGDTNSLFCFMSVRRFVNNTQISAETFVCLNGYNDYQNGANQSNSNAVIPLFNKDIEYQLNKEKHLTAWFNSGTYTWNNESLTFESNGVYKLELQNGTNTLVGVFEVNAKDICEPKYTPIDVWFINRFGGWQFLTFFKNNTQTINAENKKLDFLPDNFIYDPSRGQTKTFNEQGKQSIRCNTGWVDENYIDLIQDLMLSPRILLDLKIDNTEQTVLNFQNRVLDDGGTFEAFNCCVQQIESLGGTLADPIPVTVNTNQMTVQTGITDKTINYEIDFMFAFGLINDVI
jgi:hypothetical protein